MLKELFKEFKKGSIKNYLICKELNIRIQHPDTVTLGKFVVYLRCKRRRLYEVHENYWNKKHVVFYMEEKDILKKYKNYTFEFGEFCMGILKLMSNYRV